MISHTCACDCPWCASLSVLSILTCVRCAAHLNMLCEHAVEAYDRYGTYDESALEALNRQKAEGLIRYESPKIEVGAQRGMLVDYESLPGILPRLVLPALFGIQPPLYWLQNMRQESKEYSKGRGASPKAGAFEGDSVQKERMASATVKKFAESILSPTFQTLSANFQSAVDRLAPSTSSVPRLQDNRLDVSAVKTYPLDSPATDRGEVIRHLAGKVAYDLFPSTHNSSNYEVG